VRIIAARNGSELTVLGWCGILVPLYMDRWIGLPQEYIAADQDFHMALAEATQNQWFPLLIDILVDYLRKSRCFFILNCLARSCGCPEGDALAPAEVSKNAQARGNISRSCLTFNPTGAE
jgi:DNA-binding FadR family transcriptional regulator